MLYTESFKKQVVKKALSPGVMQKDICQKLGVSVSALAEWKKRYAAEVQTEIQEIDVAALLAEEDVDIEDLLRRAERTDLAEESGSQVIAAHIDQLMNSGKNASEYDPADKYAVIRVVRPLERGKRSLLLRRLGLCERHINQWEEELIKMSKHSISNDEHLKALEEENKRLKKQLSESERGRHELEVLIELKKKYHQLFESGEDEK